MAAMSRPSLWQQVCAIKNATRKAEAQQMYDGVQSSEALARGPDKQRSEHWKQKAAERRQELRLFLEVWG